MNTIREPHRSEDDRLIGVRSWLTLAHHHGDPLHRGPGDVLALRGPVLPIGG